MNKKTIFDALLITTVNNFFFVTDNKERLYLYLVLSIGGGIVCLLVLITARLLWQKHAAKRRDSNKFEPPGSITLGIILLIYSFD